MDGKRPSRPSDSVGGVAVAVVVAVVVATGRCTGQAGKREILGATPNVNAVATAPLAALYDSPPLSMVVLSPKSENGTGACANSRLLLLMWNMRCSRSAAQGIWQASASALCNCP